jgi:ankyrin repeat protein
MKTKLNITFIYLLTCILSLFSEIILAQANENEMHLSPKQIDVYKDGVVDYNAWFLAAENGDIGVINAFITTEAFNVNMPNRDGNTALMFAAENNHLKVVEQVLGLDGIDVNKKNVFDHTALMGAARNGHLEVVKALLATKGIDVNMSNILGMTALMLAARNGHLEVVKELLAKEGIDVNRQSVLPSLSGSLLRILGAKDGYIKTIIEALLDKIVESRLATDKITIILEEHGFNSTAFAPAAESGVIKIEDPREGPDGIAVNKKEFFHHTALMYAAQNGHLEVVKALLATKGIDVNKYTELGKTALMLAAEYGHVDVFDALTASQPSHFSFTYLKHRMGKAWNMNAGRIIAVGTFVVGTGGIVLFNPRARQGIKNLLKPLWSSISVYDQLSETTRKKFLNLEWVPKPPPEVEVAIPFYNIPQSSTNTLKEALNIIRWREAVKCWNDATLLLAEVDRATVIPVGQRWAEESMKKALGRVIMALSVISYTEENSATINAKEVQIEASKWAKVAEAYQEVLLYMVAALHNPVDHSVEEKWYAVQNQFARTQELLEKITN